LPIKYIKYLIKYKYTKQKQPFKPYIIVVSRTWDMNKEKYQFGKRITHKTWEGWCVGCNRLELSNREYWDGHGLHKAIVRIVDGVNVL
jgi:hypothetical protein